jgi:protein-S-isoprenylcysteine O-methyltransferase Ste14
VRRTASDDVRKELPVTTNNQFIHITEVLKKKEIYPPTYLFLALIIMIGLHFLFPIFQAISPPWNLSGLILIGVGLTMNVVASNAFERQKTTIKPYEEPSVLVTGGLFRVSRNPMYLGALLLLAGVALSLGSLSPFSVVPLFYFLMNEIFIKPEEKVLEETLGEAYLAYKKRVRRWL